MEIYPQSKEIMETKQWSFGGRDWLKIKCKPVSFGLDNYLTILDFIREQR